MNVGVYTVYYAAGGPLSSTALYLAHRRLLAPFSTVNEY